MPSKTSTTKRSTTVDVVTQQPGGSTSSATNQAAEGLAGWTPSSITTTANTSKVPFAPSWKVQVRKYSLWLSISLTGKRMHQVSKSRLLSLSSLYKYSCAQASVFPDRLYYSKSCSAFRASWTGLLLLSNNASRYSSSCYYYY